VYSAKDTLLQPYMSLSPATLSGRVGGEGEVVVPEQGGGRRSRGRDQGPLAAELQQEEAVIGAAAEVQGVQGAVREVAEEVEVAEQQRQ
jgi:hypothetical protein